MSEFKESHKMILYFLGGALCTLIYKINKHSFQQQEVKMSRVNNKKVLTFKELKKLVQITEEPIDVLIQGDIHKVDKLKHSSDKRYKVVYSQRKKEKIELFKSQSGQFTVKTDIGSTMKIVDRFQITDTERNSSVQISDFRYAKVLDGVLKYIKYDKIDRNPTVREIIRQPAKQVFIYLSDVEQAQFREDKAPFTTTVLSMGIAITESCLVEGTTITVYGSAVFNKHLNLIEIVSPEFFAKHKAEIVDFLNGEIRWKKFLGVLYLFGGFVFLYYFLRSLKRILQQDDQSKGQNAKIQ